MCEFIEDKTAYLETTGVIDWQHPEVYETAKRLAAGSEDRSAIALRCFTWVRDEVRHSFDEPYDPAAGVSCTASGVLQLGHGICYAKSHLLAALLRANGIPAGFDYQRLGDERWEYCLHGFNTVWLEGHGWYRIDARGNTNGIDAQFNPPEVKLAFSSDAKGEFDYGFNLSKPLPEVVRVLRESQRVDELSRTLPRSVRMG